MNYRLITAVCLVVLTVNSGASAADWLAGLAAADIQRYGEMMYREGRLPSGEPIQAFVAEDVPVDGTTLTCVSCHLRSGLGSIEGEVVTPPTNGRHLYQERKPYIVGAEFVPSYANYAKYLPVRPAYSDDTLAKLIASGVDPVGRSVLKVMPRYQIDDRDMAILIAYLKTLAPGPSPGVEGSHIRFATVIVEGTAPQKVASMLEPLEFSVARKNALVKGARANDRVARMGYNMLGDLTFVTFSLSKWILRGEPETWRSQLDAYYRQEPVYALLGGISEGEWGPVHRFCEENRIPDLFPVVDFPELTDNNWYTIYLSRGIRQEGEAAARYLNTMHELFKGRAIVQVVRDGRRGRALAQGFSDVWAELGHPPATEIVLEERQVFAPALLDKAAGEGRPAVLLLWDDATALPGLEKLAGDPERPELVLLSGTGLGRDFGVVPPALRDWLFLTWPYRPPQDDRRFDVRAHRVLAGKSAATYDPLVLRQAFVAQEVLGMVLMEMRGEYDRDFLLDMIGMMEDQYFPLYQRLTFGPDQRYASKGCYIVQIAPGEHPALERRSEWVIQ